MQLNPAMLRTMQAVVLVTFFMGLDAFYYLPENDILKDNLWYTAYWKDKPKSSSPSTDRTWDHHPSAIQIASADAKESMDYGKLMMTEEETITRNLKEKKVTLARGSPAYLHQVLFRQSPPKAKEISKKGYIMNQATSFLKNKLGLDNSRATFDLFWYDQLCDGTLSNDGLSCNPNMRYRTANGSCNNLNNPSWGAAFRPFRRAAPPDYGDGVSSLRLAKDESSLPSARLVSSRVKSIRSSQSSYFLSVLHMTYGQFLDHDLTFAPLNKGENGEAIACCPEALGDDPVLHPECAAISIPADDPFYSQFAQTCMEFVRSAPAESCNYGPREQMNARTAYIDGSQIYGSDQEMMNSLRTFEDGLLKSQVTNEGMELLPANTDLNSECNRAEQAAQNRFCFRAGDNRLNEQILLALFHIVWSRHHNKLAENLKKINPSWDDEKLFQETRRIVGAQLQHVTYNEYLPPIFGGAYKFSGLPPRSQYYYDPSISAGISAEFATAAFRFGHSQIPSTLDSVDESGDKSCSELSSFFMNPFDLYIKGNIPKLMRGEVRQSAPAVDATFSREVAGNLFKGEGLFGMDLVSLNLQRGRDHGIASYTAMRSICGHSSITSFDDLKGIMKDEVIQEFKDLYKNVEDIDLFLGGLAETPLSDGRVGPTFACILFDQFMRLKSGDRFWYESSLAGFNFYQMNELYKTSLAGILCETIPELKEIQQWPLLVPSPVNRIYPCSSYQKLNLNVFAG
ncbi:peroxidase-like [Penaeus japonicus]|uniref:peroxidase-like n=1 Tax=Penaeus japonicus TaxID=27405 RepID=UPI001C71534C|nr:peroxidase-like [Penaeus japonicus]